MCVVVVVVVIAAAAGDGCCCCCCAAELRWGAALGGYVESYGGLGATAGALGCARRGEGGGSCSGGCEILQPLFETRKK